MDKEPTIPSTEEELMTKWNKPSLQEELGELERTAEAIGVSEEELVNAFKKGMLQTLTKETWAKMINADSKDPSWTLDEARDYLKNRVAPDGTPEPRDIDAIVEAIEAGSMDAPIVLFRDEWPPYLVAGNTRLLAARGMGIEPKIFAVYLHKKE